MEYDHQKKKRMYKIKRFSEKPKSYRERTIDGASNFVGTTAGVSAAGLGAIGAIEAQGKGMDKVYRKSSKMMENETNRVSNVIEDLNRKHTYETKEIERQAKNVAKKYGDDAGKIFETANKIELNNAHANLLEREMKKSEGIASKINLAKGKMEGIVNKRYKRNLGLSAAAGIGVGLGIGNLVRSKARKKAGLDKK